MVHQSIIPRAAFTAIELLVVLGIAIFLMTMTLPSLGPAMRKSAVHTSAGAIMDVSAQAQALARRTPVDSPADSARGRWGIRVTATDAVLLLGSVAADAAIAPAVSRRFNRGVTVMAASPLSAPGETGPLTAPVAPLVWFYEPGTGIPCVPDGVDSYGQTAWRTCDIGTPGQVGQIGTYQSVQHFDAAGNNPQTSYLWLTADQPQLMPSPVASRIEVRSLDGRYAAALAIYRVGLGHVEGL